ncbi:hypothetical protein [Cyanobium sp. NIES-981]|uniref:hypothetical protein n=1 Tax=Cyanobium sp. NIES-981 TaxID=1851505 RepID=UPI000B355F4C|nr:hypothetical protein [Cyanobium sp. NIES-981]
MGAVAWAHAMKLPEGWKVWLAVLALNGMAGAMWFVNRGIERPEAGGSLWAILRSLGSGGVG